MTETLGDKPREVGVNAALDFVMCELRPVLNVALGFICKSGLAL